MSTGQAVITVVALVVLLTLIALLVAVIVAQVSPKTLPPEKLKSLLINQALGDWVVRMGVRTAMAVSIGWAAIVGGAVFLHVVNTALRELYIAEHLIGDGDSEIRGWADAFQLAFSSHAAREGFVAAMLALVLLVMLLLAALTVAIAVYFAHRTYWTVRIFRAERPPPIVLGVGKGVSFAEQAVGGSMQSDLFERTPTNGSPEDADLAPTDQEEQDVVKLLWAVNRRLDATERRGKYLEDAVAALKKG